MRKSIASAAAAVLALGVATTAPAVAGSSSTTPPAADPAAKLAEKVTVNGVLQHLRELQTIANRNDGNRASGLPGYDASATYVIKQLRAAGYVVKQQKFTFPFSRDLEPATLTQTAPENRSIDTTSFTYSGSGDVTGRLVPINVTIPPGEAGTATSGCDAADFPDPGDDPAVALVQRGTCDFGVKAANAQEASYDAVVIFNEGQEGRTELIEGTLGTPVDIPVVGTTYADGKALAEATDPEVRVTTKTEVDLERETTNVIADLPTSVKTAKPNETVVVGAHLDSVPDGAGINDNGSGTATILETAEQLAESGTKKLQRPVRFAFWGAEELGLLGSYEYVDSLSAAQRAKIYANLNFDMLGSPNFARFVYDGDGSSLGTVGPPGSGAIEKIFTDYFSSKKLATAPTAFDGRSDYGPFIEVGIPAGGLFSGAEGVKTAAEKRKFGGTAGEAYDVCYHSACDTITNINTSAINELGKGAAFATYALTMRSQGLYPDGSVAPKSAARAGALEAPTPGSQHASVK